MPQSAHKKAEIIPLCQLGIKRPLVIHRNPKLPRKLRASHFKIQILILRHIIGIDIRVADVKTGQAVHPAIFIKFPRIQVQERIVCHIHANQGNNALRRPGNNLFIQLPVLAYCKNFFSFLCKNIRDSPVDLLRRLMDNRGFLV